MTGSCRRPEWPRGSTWPSTSWRPSSGRRWPTRPPTTSSTVGTATRPSSCADGGQAGGRPLTVLRGDGQTGHTVSMAKARTVVLEVAGREVVITNPDKIFFSTGHTKLDLVRYYAAVAEGALRGVAGRPIVLKRYVDGAEREPFFQKRAPEEHPEWVETVELRFPSGRTAREIVVRDAAQLLWIVNLGCIDLNPHPVRADDLEHPDELRVDLDPGAGVSWDDVRRVALVVRDVLEDHGLRGWPKTSGSRGMHVNVRIERRWSFDQVRRAALALAREVERRAPEQATSKWWKEERHGVFLDYNQNAKDRTVASAWSVRPTPDARVSMPLTWDEVADCDPAAFTLVTGRTRSPASSGGRRGIRRPPVDCTWMTSSSTRCVVARARGRASESTCVTFPRANARPRNRPIPTTTPGATRELAGAPRARRRHARAHRPARPRAGRNGSLLAACRDASERSARRDGTESPACDRRRPRRRVRAGAAPSSGPCRGSNGWSRRAGVALSRSLPPRLRPSHVRDHRRARFFEEAPGRRRAACARRW